MNKKAPLIATILALVFSTTNAAQRDYYTFESPAPGNPLTSANNYTPYTLQDVVNAIQGSGYGINPYVATPFNCVGWSTYYNAGTLPIPEGTRYYRQYDDNGVAYTIPLYMWGCTKRYNTPPALPDQYVYDKPASHVICNAGFSVSTTTVTGGGLSRCVPDSQEQQTAHSTNQQGVPSDCPICDARSTFRGDPVNAANGNELQVQLDYEGAGGNLLSLSRTYNSGTGFTGASYGYGWTHNYNFRALIDYSTAATITLVRPDGGSLLFTRSGNSYISENPGQGNISATFAGSGISNFTYIRPDGTQEFYNNGGQLLTITLSQGGTLTYQYSGFPSGVLNNVSDGRGHKITFTYGTVAGTSRPVAVTLPDGKSITYGYDSAGRLNSVTYPDNAVRTYAYADDQPSKLTRIVDENNSTFATITYDGLGRATSTQHGSGAELTTFTYGGTSTTVTNSLGVQEVMSFVSLIGRPRTQAVTVRCDNGCPIDGATNQFIYDTTGNTVAAINKLGVKTCFAYDTTRNLPTKVVDNLPSDAGCAAALSSPPASSRVKAYQWHASLAVPLTVTGPLSKVTATYDSAGRKLTQTEYETTDTTGASGVSASTTGTSRTTTWTYNSQGSVLTVKAPRTDVNATTTYAYDSNQNLTSVTDEAGLVTTFGSYDANGRPQVITTPNGLQTTLAYDVRGRTTSITTAGATTTYGYDAVGQLTSSVLPSGVTVTFTYDDAHRLIATADSFGNRVDRTLDSEGNVLQETVTGNGSVLAMSRQTAYDQLSRATSLIQAQ